MKRRQFIKNVRTIQGLHGTPMNRWWRIVVRYYGFIDYDRDKNLVINGKWTGVKLTSPRQMKKLLNKEPDFWVAYLD